MKAKPYYFSAENASQVVSDRNIALIHRRAKALARPYLLRVPWDQFQPYVNEIRSGHVADMESLLKHEGESAALTFMGDDYLADMPLWAIESNTILELGTTGEKVLQRLKTGGYLEADDRRWFAGVVETALLQGQLRNEIQWRAVAEYLRSGTSPVIAGWRSKPHSPKSPPTSASMPYADWLRMSEAGRWEWLLTEARSHEASQRICQDAWDSFRYVAPVSAVNLANSLSLFRPR